MYQEVFGIQEELFRTIASRKRLELIQLLHDRELTVSEIASMLGIRQANASQHLSELRKARIVLARRDGVTIHYQLSDPRITQICNLAKAFLVEQHAFTPETAAILDSESNLFPVVIDPVCNMRLSRTYAASHTEHRGVRFYFCASGCHDAFVNHPEKYTNTPRR